MLVSLVYSPGEGLPQRHWSLALTEEAATVLQALNMVGFYDAFPEARDYAVGIFSKVVSLDTTLSEGDRVEIYRPLSKDPKQARRLRAKG